MVRDTDLQQVAPPYSEQLGSEPTLVIVEVLPYNHSPVKTF